MSNLYGESSGLGRKRKAPEKLQELHTRRGKVIELNEVRTIELCAASEVSDEIKRNSQILMEASNWESAFRSKMRHLKAKEKELDKTYYKVWKTRENFCAQVDKFIRHFDKYTKPGTDPRERDIDEQIKEIAYDAEILSMKVTQKEAIVEILSKKLNLLERERLGLAGEKESLEMKRLEEWIRLTCGKCVELEKQIESKRAALCKKNLEVARAHKNANIYTFVRLDDVKKMPAFTTATKPPSTENALLDKKE